jgi:DNA-binding CsgD family transcriptional regulator
MYAQTRPQVSPATALDALERRVKNPRPVAPSTLIRREKAVYRWVRRLESAIDLLDVNDDSTHAAYMHLTRLLGRAYALHSTACAKCAAAYEEHLIAQHEAEELGAALQLEQVSDLLYGVGLVA